MGDFKTGFSGMLKVGRFILPLLIITDKSDARRFPFYPDKVGRSAGKGAASMYKAIPSDIPAVQCQMQYIWFCKWKRLRGIQRQTLICLDVLEWLRIQIFLKSPCFVKLSSIRNHYSIFGIITTSELEKTAKGLYSKRRPSCTSAEVWFSSCKAHIRFR